MAVIQSCTCNPSFDKYPCMNKYKPGVDCGEMVWVYNSRCEDCVLQSLTSSSIPNCSALSLSNLIKMALRDSVQSSQMGTVKPTITSLQDLILIEAWDNDANAPKYVTFYHITDEAELWFGQSFKNKREMSLEEYQHALEPVPDEEIYPEIPADAKLTIAPDNIDDPMFVKRPGLNCYESMKGTPYVWKSVLDETLIMEKVSKNPHPYIIKYYGCRTARGRITSLVLKSYECTLTQFARQPGFKDLDKEKFLDNLESAVTYVHSLGLAHNDINPDNIMMGEDGVPVLIDFGSCAPYGQNLQSLGTDGWYEEVFFTSEKSHDDFALKKMRSWIQDPPV